MEKKRKIINILTMVFVLVLLYFTINCFINGITLIDPYRNYIVYQNTLIAIYFLAFGFGLTAILAFVYNFFAKEKKTALELFMVGCYVIAIILLAILTSVYNPYKDYDSTSTTYAMYSLSLSNLLTGLASGVCLFAVTLTKYILNRKYKLAEDTVPESTAQTNEHKKSNKAFIYCLLGFSIIANVLAFALPAAYPLRPNVDVEVTTINQSTDPNNPSYRTTVTVTNNSDYYLRYVAIYYYYIDDDGYVVYEDTVSYGRSLEAGESYSETFSSFDKFLSIGDIDAYGITLNSIYGLALIPFAILGYAIFTTELLKQKSKENEIEETTEENTQEIIEENLETNTENNIENNIN